MAVAYRVFVSALGLLLVAAAPGTATVSTEPPKPASDKVTPETIKLSAEMQPCERGSDNRKSDLCAQWKAADAASSSADWAYWTMLAGAVGLLIGGGTLFAAWRAAHWAKEAAKHTEVGAQQSERSAKAAEIALEQSRLASQTDLRAWVATKVKLLDYNRKKDFADFSIEVCLSNIGKTPAFDVAVSYEITPEITFVTNYGVVPKVEKFPHQLTPIMPNASVTQRFGIRIENDAIDRAIAAAVRQGSAVMVVVDIVAYYRTVFDEFGTRERTTSARYLVHPDVDPSMEVAWRQIGQSWLNDQNRTATFLKFVQDKSAPAHLS